MREIRLIIHEDRLKYPDLTFSERLAKFLLAHLDGTASKQEFDYFCECGVAVAIDGYPAHAEASPDEQATEPLYRATNTIRDWAEAEPIEMKKRWFVLAEEAAMTAIHLAEQGKRGDVLGQWPVDEFTRHVWSLAQAMHERGITVEEAWFGQEFGFVLKALAARGLSVSVQYIDEAV